MFEFEFEEEKERKTVAVVVSGIMDEFTDALCKGIISEAENDNLNIIVVPVKYIDREMKNIPDAYEYQYKMNINNITTDNVDVIVVAADTIGCLTTEENLKKFMGELKAKGKPIILAAARMDGYPGVTFDNKEGIIDALNYLIEDLGVTNLCMMKSWDYNSDVAERYEAFRETLENHSLTLSPNSVVTTKLSADCKEEAEWLLDMNPDVEAIFCVNDAVAMGLYAVMQDRGLVPGKDIKVLGFDNSVSGGMITPSLSTVDASAEKMGARIIGMIRRLLEGWDVGEMTIPTRFIHRDSFGSLLDKEDVDYRILNKSYLDEYFRRVFFKFENLPDDDGFETLIMFKSLMSVIIDYVDDMEYSPERVIFLKSKVDEFFKTGALKYTDVNVLLTYVERMKEAVLSRFDNYERKCHVYETFSAILEKVAVTLNGNIETYKKGVKDSLSLLRKIVDDNMSFKDHAETGYMNILNNLLSIGVKNGYVYIYDEPIPHLQGEEFKAPKTVNLKAAMRDGVQVEIPEDESVISIDNLYNNKFITDDKYNMVILPLYWQENLYGSLLFDVNDVAYRGGDFLANQAGLASWIIDILIQNNKMKMEMN